MAAKIQELEKAIQERDAEVEKKDDRIIGYLKKIKELKKGLKAAEEDKQQLATVAQSGQEKPPELVKDEDITFTKFDKDRYAILDDHK